jgi:hypothetical protein
MGLASLLFITAACYISVILIHLVYDEGDMKINVQPK